MAKDAYYFPHDSNAKDDPKCVLLIEQLGMEGYGIYWVLIETLRDQPGYRYPLALTPALARRYNTQTAKLEAVITGYGLFKVENGDFFYSESLDKRMLSYDAKRDKARLAGQRSGEVRRQISFNGRSTIVQQTFSECLTDLEPEEERREELSKKDIKPMSDELPPDAPIEQEKEPASRFKEFWDVYPRKDNKKKSESAFNRLKKSEIDTVIADVIARSKTEAWMKENRKYVPMATTYLNGRRWEDVKSEANSGRYEPYVNRYTESTALTFED